MKRSFLFLLMFTLVVNSVMAQTNNPVIQYKNDCVYFFARGTMTKRNIIAKDFNLSDTNITHVGLGLFISGKMEIYHVVPEKKAFVKQQIEEFISPPDIFHFEIWQLRLSKRQLSRLLHSVNDSSNNIIQFDYSFELGNDKLYCAEFVWEQLQQLKKNDLFFKPVTLNLSNETYRAMFKKESISIIPIDFFKTLPNIKLIYSCHNCAFIK